MKFKGQAEYFKEVATAPLLLGLYLCVPRRAFDFPYQESIFKGTTSRSYEGMFGKVRTGGDTLFPRWLLPRECASAVLAKIRDLRGPAFDVCGKKFLLGMHS